MLAQWMRRVRSKASRSPSRRDTSRERPNASQSPPPTSQRQITAAQQARYYDSINRLLMKCDEEESASSSDDDQLTPEERCCVCLGARATIQFYPCAHMACCKRCSVGIIKNLVDQDENRMKCVICRTPIARLKNCKRALQPVVRMQTPPPYELNFRSRRNTVSNGSSSFSTSSESSAPSTSAPAASTWTSTTDTTSTATKTRRPPQGGPR